MAANEDLKQLEEQIGKGIDDAVDTLRWCKRHRHERKAIESIRVAQMNLGYLSLAMDWEMEGELGRAREALGHVWWSPSKEPMPSHYFDWGH